MVDRRFLAARMVAETHRRLALPLLARIPDTRSSGQRPRLGLSHPRIDGDRVEDFAGEVRELLASRSPDGVFWDWPGDTEVILARKPGRR